MNVGIGFRAVSNDKDSRIGFAAAAVSIGFDLVDNTPGVSNVYSAENKYEPEQPGDVRYYLPLSSGAVQISEIASVWLDPRQALERAEALPQRITSANNGQELAKICVEFDSIYIGAAVAHMRLFSLSRITLPTIAPTDEETQAVEYLDGFARALEDCYEASARKKATKALHQKWKPAMISWIRAYKANYLELSNLWKEVPKSLKIARGNGLPPLVLPQGPKFDQMLKRWT
jgi:hypothetical protein